MVATLHLVVLLPFVFALFVPRLSRKLKGNLGWAILPLPLLATLFFLSQLVTVGTGESVASTWVWAPNYGISFSLLLDGFSLLFALLISGIGTLVLLYSIFYLDPAEDLSRFYISILLFMGAMFGVVLSENLLTLYMFWEITSISSFLLIGFWHTRSEARDGALKSMLITVLGGFSLLAGFLLLGSVGETYSVRELVAKAPVILSHPFYPAIVLLVLLGAFTKSAQVPFHLWLPGAMAAPTPVSAYLHSATMVKAGIYLTARMSTLLGGSELWFYLVATVGISTMCLGAYLAVQQRDLKALLAFSTVSQLGFILTTFAFGTAEATAAGVLHILNHGIFKGMLFMLVGIIDHQTGTRDIERLSGLRASMPITGLLMFVGAFSMAGVPFLNGFVSKEMILEALLHPPLQSSLFTQALPVLAVLGSTFTTIYSLLLSVKLFFGPKDVETPVAPKEASLGLLFSPVVLGVLVVVLGLFPGLVETHLVTAGTEALLGRSETVHLAVWHGLTPALFMSAAALLIGGFGYSQLDRIMPLLRRLSSVRLNMNTVYVKSLEILEKGSKLITGRMLTGYLRDYLTYILGFAVLFMIYSLLRLGVSRLYESFVSLNAAWTPVTWNELAVVVVLIVASLAAVFARQRIAVALTVGTVGFMVAVLWFFWNAPDLALTQTIVETVSIVPLFLAFGFMPPLRERQERRPAKRLNIVVAVAVGVAAGMFNLVGTGFRLFESIGHYFVENSLTLGGGRNIVNVILVDFRGFDTLFETTVFAVVAIAIYTLVRTRQDPGVVVKAGSPIMINPIIVPAISRVLFYLVLVFSLYLFFRGHNHPGGGFAGGVMGASAIVIWALAFERSAAMKLVPIHPRYVIGLGLLTIVGLGLAGVLAGYPFLTQSYGHYRVPFIGDVELASALLFDLGVWLVVFGTIYWMVHSMSDGVPLEQEHVTTYRAALDEEQVSFPDGTVDSN